MSALFENVINEVNSGLIFGSSALPGLSWLDNAYGRAEAVVLKEGSKSFKVPAIATGGNEYKDLSPNDSLGSYSFFMASDYETTFNRGVANTFEADYDLIFWFNMSEIAEPRSLYSVAGNIYNLLMSIKITSGRITIEKVHDNTESVYQAFDLNEVDKKYLRQPYGALRITGKITYKDAD